MRQPHAVTCPVPSSPVTENATSAPTMLAIPMLAWSHEALRPRRPAAALSNK